MTSPMTPEEASAEADEVDLHASGFSGRARHSLRRTAATLRAYASQAQTIENMQEVVKAGREWADEEDEDLIEMREDAIIDALAKLPDGTK